MNTKRIVFWIAFVLVLGLIIWGLVASMSKPSIGLDLGTPAPVTSADHITGPANAPVTLIEYGDFECPACGAYSSIIERLMVDASTTLRIVFRHFPLPQHLNAMIAAQASEAASDQGKFWDMYRLLYANQDSWANLSDPDARAAFAGYASELGLNAEQFRTDIDASSTKAVVTSEQAEGQSIALNYTPTFFVNGKAIENPQSYEAFKAVIDAAAK